jgi:hypothetical protein
MSSSTIPMNRFDMLAGAKASYETFYSLMGKTPTVPWHKLTQNQQRIWVVILREGIKAAKDTRDAKKRRVT